MAIPACVQAFILALLCGNPLLRSAWVTLLNSLILQLSEEVDLLTLQIARLNVLNQINSQIINSFEALKSKVSADLNLFLGPLQQFNGCVDLQKISKYIHLNAVGRKAAALKKKLYEFNRVTNLVQVQNAIKQAKEQQITDLQNFVDAITELCD